MFSSSPSKSFNNPKQTRITTIEPAKRSSLVFVVIRARIKTTAAIPAFTLSTPRSSFSQHGTMFA